jgi:hypothetical protein
VKNLPSRSYVFSEYPGFNWEITRSELWRKHRPKGYAPYPEFVKFLQDNDIMTWDKYYEFRRDNKGQAKQFPTYKTIQHEYPEFNWSDIRPEGWSRSWNSTNFEPYEEFLDFVKRNEIYTGDEYKSFRRDYPKLVEGFPHAQGIFDEYPEFDWKNMRPEGWIAKRKLFKPYSEFVKFLISNEIMTGREYMAFSKKYPELTKGYPSWGYIRKKRGYPEFDWNDIRPTDWSPRGNKTKMKNYREFVDFAVSKQITSSKLWLDYISANGIPEGMYLEPWDMYQGFDWSHVWQIVHPQLRRLEQRDYGERYESKPEYNRDASKRYKIIKLSKFLYDQAFSNIESQRSSRERGGAIL